VHSQSSPVRCALTDVIVVTHHQHTAGMELKVSSHGRNSFSCLPSTKVQFTCEPSPGADVAAASPVPAQMWQRRAQSRRRCGRVSHWAGRWPRPRSARSSRGCHRPHCIRRRARQPGKKGAARAHPRAPGHAWRHRTGEHPSRYYTCQWKPVVGGEVPARTHAHAQTPHAHAWAYPIGNGRKMRRNEVAGAAGGASGADGGSQAAAQAVHYAGD
jgi:hypothetical protein